MYYLLGARDCYFVAQRAVWPHVSDYLSDDWIEWKEAYASFLDRLQPYVPRASAAGTVFSAQPRFIAALMDGFMRPSILDDLDRYKEPNFIEYGEEYAARMQQDLDHVSRHYERFLKVDDGFWTAFEFFVNYLICPVSSFTRGGSDSSRIGLVYVCSPQTYTDADLYELLVHEFTHNVMFVDELTVPHYVDDERLTDERYFAIGSVTEKMRPLDKVLHSMVIATEVLLHRANVIGHPRSSAIHPLTPRLVANTRRTIESMRAIPDADQVLTPHAFELMEVCEMALSGI